jgi:hypothetical protein
MDCPCNATELRIYIGCVKYYCDMLPNHAHILKPLIDQSGLKKRAPIKWTSEMQRVQQNAFAHGCQCSCSLSGPQ